MARFDRSLRILYLLDKGESCTVRSLADEFHVDERTVHRDIFELRAAKFPIDFDKQRGSYVFEEGFKLGKIKLNVQEVLALAVAKRMLTPLGDSFMGALESVETKLLNITPTRGQGMAPSAFVVSCQDANYSNDSYNLIKELSQATREHSLVRLSYESLYAREVTSREVEPYYLFYSQEGFWYLRAYCCLRADWRTFALDRIKKWKVLSKYFAPRLFADEIGKEVLRGFDTYMDGEPEEVVVQFSPEIRSFVERRTWHPSQVNKDLENGWLEVTFTTTGTEGLKYWLYRWTPHFRVVSPRWLQDDMTNELRSQLDLLQPRSESNCDSE